MKNNYLKYVSAIFVVLCFIAFTIAVPTSAKAQQKLTITSFGGSLQTALRKAFFEPFAAKYGVEILEDEWHGEMAKLKAMVESGNVTWDVLDTSGGQRELGCDEGLLEPLDPKMYGGKDAFVTLSECAVGVLVAGIVIGYDATQFAGNEPTKLTDFWDVKKFPGPRSMKKWPKQTMEFALLADGVPRAKIYDVLATEEGIARAFKKLDEIKPHVKVWFTSWAQPGQLLADGEVAMSMGTNGRLLVAQEDHPNVNFMWDSQLIGYDNWSIVKGSKNKDLAIKFIQFASLPENQAQLPKYIKYGPAVKAAIDLLPPDVAKMMPSHPDNLKSALEINSRFWSDNMDDYSIRFNAWLGE